MENPEMDRNEKQVLERELSKLMEKTLAMENELMYLVQRTK